MELRSKCLRRASGNADTLYEQLERDTVVLPEGTDNRAGANWELLIVIGDDIGGAWPDRVRFLAKQCERQVESRSITVILLADIKIAFGNNDRMATAMLIAQLCADQELGYLYEERRADRPGKARAAHQGLVWIDENLFNSRRDPKGFLERTTRKAFNPAYYATVKPLAHRPIATALQPVTTQPRPVEALTIRPIVSLS
jgi:hypothetical protein